MRRPAIPAGILLAALSAAAAGAAGPAPGPAEVVPGGQFIDGDPALGEYLSGECVTCHQITGNYDGIPAIVGWPAVWFVQAMTEYRTGKRANPVMRTIAGRYSGEEIAALAVYFESVIKYPPR